MFTKPTLICVVGPTAIGKTALAIKLATAFDAEIISADSRQFYQEMTIGTAVPSAEELQAAIHHFIQHKSIFTPYSVGDFERDALHQLHLLFKKSNVVIMAGGSGLYVKAISEGLDKFPEVPMHIRDELNEELETEGLEKLQTELQQLDPKQYAATDTKNPRRIIRALEVYRASGKPYSSFIKTETAERYFQTVYIGLTAERELIYTRINKRVDLMMAAGLLDEAKDLYPHRALNALQTVGYKELFQFIERTMSLEQAVAEIKKNTRRFAKRQLTWFNKNSSIQWFDHDAEMHEIIAALKAKNTP